MRLIDADALIELLKTKSDAIGWEKEPAVVGTLLGAINIINHAPTIEPTAHCPNCGAKWRHHDIGRGD